MADLEVVPRVEEDREEEKGTKARGYLKRNPRAKWIVIAVAVVLLIGGQLVILVIVPLAGLRLLAKRMAPARPHAAAGPEGGPPGGRLEPLTQRSAVDDTHEGSLAGESSE